MDFLPTLSEYDIERTAELLQQAYAPSASTLGPEQHKRLQHDLFEIQKRPEAWGLVIPLLNHQDQNVQFFGAHTAQVKIARDWETFPKEHAESLRDMMVHLTSRSIAVGRNRVILRKLFVALTSLALKLVPGHPSRWPDWIHSCVSAFSTQGASSEHIHDFLAIVAEELGNADLLGPSKIQLQQSLSDATNMTVQTIKSVIAQPLGTTSTNNYLSALKCLQAWMPDLKGDDLASIVPLLIAILNPEFPEESIFVAASDALQELTTKSALSDGAGSRTVTEPLLVWSGTVGNRIMEASLSTGEVSSTSHSLCKLLVSLGDHSASYLAMNIASSMPISTGPATSPTTKGHLVQNFLRLLLAYTALPGYYGVDEEESEMTLGFWYLLQEALWTADFSVEIGNDHSSVPPDLDENGQSKQISIAKAVYMELAKVLRRKVTFPPGSGWSRDQVDKFQVYRRDVGDTLINAYYVLRNEMLTYYIDDIADRLATRQEADGWQEMEASLHCIMSIQEAVDMEKSPQLQRLFNPEIFGRLPSTGRPRIRRTALSVVGAYSSWFAAHVSNALPGNGSNLLLTVLSYVVSALPDASLCLTAATALRNLCEANRKALAVHIGAFGELHSSLDAIPDAEKSKILQSIASVVQAMPVDQEISAIEAIVNPIVETLYKALQSASNDPEGARLTVILQLEILAGVAKGLTRTVDGSTVLEDETDPAYQAEFEKNLKGREDRRSIVLRENIFSAVRGVVELWSADAAIGQALSDLVKAITALPADTTLITLPASPLLELICLAVQRQLTATWLSLGAILIAQLNPPVFSVGMKGGPTPEAELTVRQLLPILLQCSLTYLGTGNAMENNPDIVQEFFGCMDRVAQDFTQSFYSLPQELLDALLRCSIKALSLQERYSLVSACNFLSTLVNRSSLTGEVSGHKTRILTLHGYFIMKAVLEGFAGIAPRSAVQNLIELLGTLLSRASGQEGSPDGGAPLWMKDILTSDGFVPSKAGPEDKSKLLKAVTGTRSVRRIKDAAQQFTLVARGLEGSNFGYSSMTM